MGIPFVPRLVVPVGNIVHMELVETPTGVALNAATLLDVIVILLLTVPKCEALPTCACSNAKDKEGNMNNENIVKGADPI